MCVIMLWVLFSARILIESLENSPLRRQNKLLFTFWSVETKFSSRNISSITKILSYKLNFSPQFILSMLFLPSSPSRETVEEKREFPTCLQNLVNIQQGPDSVVLQVSVDGNTTISTLHLAPSVSQHGKALRCRAENSNLPGSVLENFITLEVSCKWFNLIIAFHMIFYYKCSSSALYMAIRSK